MVFRPSLLTELIECILLGSCFLSCVSSCLSLNPLSFDRSFSIDSDQVVFRLRLFFYLSPLLGRKKKHCSVLCWKVQVKSLLVLCTVHPTWVEVELRKLSHFNFMVSVVYRHLVHETLVRVCCTFFGTATGRALTTYTICTLAQLKFEHGCCSQLRHFGWDSELLEEQRRLIFFTCVSLS